jgi:uridine kinase
MPVFDFKSGSRSDRTIPVQLGERHILLIEGIHGINEALTCDIPAENKLKIYISCMTALNLDDFTPISTSDNREIRRLVRDVKFRNISAEKTLLTWQKVRSGEEKNIFPFQDSADYYFNTSLIYEFSLLAPLITPHLQAIQQTSPAYPEARRLLKLVSCFIPGDPKAVPAYSLLQEFLGGSVFEI